MMITDLSVRDSIRVEEAVEKRLTAKSLETQAKELKLEADKVLLPILQATEGSKIEMEDESTLSMSTRKSTRTDMDTLKTRLFQMGVPVDQIARAIADATTTTDSAPFITLRIKKQKG